MRDHAPEEWAEAVAVDAAIRAGTARGAKAIEFMHDTRLPLPEAIALVERERREQPDLFSNECSGICGV